MTAAPTSYRFYRVDPKSSEVVAINASLLGIRDHTQRKKKEVFVMSNRVEFELTPGLAGNPSHKIREELLVIRPELTCRTAAARLSSSP